jgi:hypothetical protein
MLRKQRLGKLDLTREFKAERRDADVVVLYTRIDYTSVNTYYLF